MKAYAGTEADENNNSLVLRVKYGRNVFLLAADIEVPAEVDILDYGRDLRSTVVKVPHHGSLSSSSSPFVEFVRPELAVFSCGRYNDYGLPEFEVIRRYENAGARILRTGMDGSIEIIGDEKAYMIKKWLHE